MKYPKPHRFLLFWISSHGFMMGFEEIGTGTTSTLEAVWRNDLESFLAVWFKDSEASCFSYNSFLWSCDSSWRNSMVSCICCRCRERLARVSLLMCTMSSSLEMIKLWRMFINWICCVIWTCSLEILSEMLCFELFHLISVLEGQARFLCGLNGTLAWFVAYCACLEHLIEL